MSNLIKRIFSSVVLLFIVFFSFKSSIILLSLLVLISYFSISEFNFLFSKIFKKICFYHFLFVFLSVVYIASFSVIIWIYLTPINHINSIFLVFLLLICVSTDIGGFVFGKLIGGKKLTKISPNKTYSGAIGSFFLSFINGYLLFTFQIDYLMFEKNIFIIIALVSFFSQLGDLLISLLKRKAKIKDTGKILPGHGGVLDRVDGILVALPVGILLISI